MGRRWGSTGRRRRITLALVAGCGTALLAPGPASALDHLIDVREVFTGTTGHPNAEFIEIQMYAGNQHFVAGNKLHVYNAGGTEVGTYTFPADETNGTNQSSILVATADAASFFGVPADLAVTPSIPATGGSVCYEDVDQVTAGFIDCVSWGTFTAPPPSSDPGAVSGTPFNVPVGLPSGLSMNRDISGGSNPSLLDALDDTNDSAADFDLLNPAGPRNNSGTVTTTAGQASIAAGTMTYTGGSTVANNLLVSRGGNFYLVRDLTAPVNAGAGCIQSKTNLVRCAVASVSAINVNTGSGHDKVLVADTVDATVNGGIGNDRLISLNGDTILMGDAGNDVLDPGTGTDDMSGGTGSDTATYAPRGASAGVDVDIDNLADDGSIDDANGVGVRDNVRTDVERVIGGAGADELTGNNSPNRLTGGGGADILRGLGATDFLFANGDGAVDTLFCGAGAGDHAFADPGDSVPTSGPEACELVN